MIIINPFDFFLEPETETFPFTYDPKLEIGSGPYLAAETPGKTSRPIWRKSTAAPEQIIDFLVKLNQKLNSDIRYLIRMEPNVQSCEQTLTLGNGSCRDSAWLLVNILRHLGLAARFVSGYLIQLAPDVKSLDGPSGPEADFTDLHAWTEVYLPGAGWVGHGPHLGPVCRRRAHPPGLLARSPRARPPSPARWTNAKWISATIWRCSAFGKRPAPPGPIRRTSGQPSSPWAIGWIGNWRRPTCA